MLRFFDKTKNQNWKLVQIKTVVLVKSYGILFHCHRYRMKLVSLSLFHLDFSFLKSLV